MVYFIPSAAVNLGIYIPPGLFVKASVYTPSFVELMLISFVLFATDLVIVSLLTLREYRKPDNIRGVLFRELIQGLNGTAQFAAEPTLIQ